MACPINLVFMNTWICPTDNEIRKEICCSLQNTVYDLLNCNYTRFIMIIFYFSDLEYNFHYVVDCAKPVMKEHCYWPLVSDLNNVLSHRPVALKFMSDDSLLEMWFTFLSVFQGTV